jgi:AraC-like DNA-binding protein
MKKNSEECFPLIREFGAPPAPLKAKLLHRLPEPGSFSTAIPGFQLSRRDREDLREYSFFQPMIAVPVQGSLRSIIEDTEFAYGEGSYLAVSVDTPGIVRITKASPEKPFLSLAIALDRYTITQLAAELPAVSSGGIVTGKAAGLAEVTPEMFGAFLRLVELLDTPERIPALAPLVIREIHYYVLTGSLGGSLRIFTQNNRIAQAISWLRKNYREPLRIADLAAMAESTFNRYFHSVTGLSPLQFQKRLRLYEAQRLMLTENKSAETAAFDVGYDSPAQFSREYKRQFGEPPHRDIQRLVMAESIRRRGGGLGIPVS